MRATIFFALLLAGLLLSSCAAPPVQQMPPVDVEEGFDTTPRDVDARARVAAATIPQIGARSHCFALRAVDHNTSLITTAVPEDEDAAYKILLDIIHNMVPVTDLCLYFESQAALYEHSDTKVVIVIYTDGLDDGKPAEVAARIRKAAARLAANPNVLGVVIVGSVRDTRPGWTGLSEMLAPLKSRLHVIPHADMDPDRILQEVKAVRLSGSRR